MALFAVLATQAPTAGEREVFLRRLPEGFAYTKELVDKGVIRHSWIRVGASGGLNIYDVGSHEELLSVLYSNPVSPYLKFEVIPLAEPESFDPAAYLLKWDAKAKNDSVGEAAHVH
ncbi:muconolactone Delta-isomerase family protein [Streptomyces sp. NPDC006332]|uniref:muconolactone Delta-isomerase family protein n=1 Tax=Streptomyces sp. NPDC006332 TaxID=3155456 RepID=UPI0033A47AB1